MLAICVAGSMWVAGSASAQPVDSTAAGDPSAAGDPTAASGAWFTAIELHGSFLSDAADRSALGDTFGYGVRGGVRWDAWGAFLHVEQNRWLTSEFDRTTTQGALNLGLGGEYIFFEGRARTSLAIGPSFLLFDTLIDDAGEVGLFVDIRPVGLRWQLSRRWLLMLDPLTFTLVAPVLGGIPLILPEYRLAVTLELGF